MKLPNYQTEPGVPGFLTDCIQSQEHLIGAHNDARSIRWKCSYQGEVDYLTRGEDRLKFRWARVSWSLGHWNYANEDLFNRQHNGNWGMLTIGNNPVDAATLEEFRRLYHPLAVTGFFNHATGEWEVCEPSNRQLSTESWERGNKLKAA